MLKSFINRLQTIFQSKFNVFEEENIDLKTGKDICIVKNYSSVNYLNAVQFGLQLQFLTNDVPNTMEYLSLWSFEQHETAFSVDDFPYVKQYVTQPVNNSNFLQEGINYAGSIVLTITLMASFRLTDIKEIYLDNELFNPTQITISYNTVPDNQRNNDEELNSTIINEANLQCQVVFPCDNANFAKKVRNIMFGKLSKNLDFNIKLVFTDDEQYELAFKMVNKSLNKQSGVLTTDSVTLVH
jgi:hypothetical protein